MANNTNIIIISVIGGLVVLMGLGGMLGGGKKDDSSKKLHSHVTTDYATHWHSKDVASRKLENAKVGRSIVIQKAADTDNFYNTRSSGGKKTKKNKTAKPKRR